MAFTPEQSRNIIAAISRRVPNLGTCTVCRDQKAKWTLANGIISLPLQSVSSVYPNVWGSTGIGIQETMLAYGLVCSTCGHIELLSAAALGNPHIEPYTLPPPIGLEPL